jgi:hypothetical protein
MTESLVTVTLNLNNTQRYEGELEPLAVVHDALVHLLPSGAMSRQRLQIRASNSDLIFPDMFIGEVNAHYGNCDLHVTTVPLQENTRDWRHVGFDHLALSVQDRARARDFFHNGLKMQIVRDDEHITVVTTGNTALFFFDAEPGKPLSDGVPSRIHHIGFVVDDLEAAYSHLQANFPELTSDFTVLERMERYSLYGRYTIGDVTFIIQISQIKDGYRGFNEPNEYADVMYDYRSRPYGIRFERD